MIDPLLWTKRITKTVLLISISSVQASIFASRNKLQSLISISITHQIFSFARDWSKRVTWANIPQLRLGISDDIRQFLKPMDNKHNSLNLAVKICSDICPWTLSVPRSSQFSSSFALGKLFASRNR